MLPEDVDIEEDPFAMPGAARARSDTSGRSPFSELNAGAQPLPRIGEDDFDMAPPPPPDEDEDDGSPQEDKAKVRRCCTLPPARCSCARAAQDLHGQGAEEARHLEDCAKAGQHHLCAPAASRL